MKLKKGSIEAKRFMAKIRAKKKPVKKISGIYETIKRQGIKAKKNVAYSVIDKTLKSANVKEKASLKNAKKIIQNTYLGSNLHKDTKSHNVKISVMSGSSLNPTQKKLYSKIVTDYDKNGWYKLTSLDKYVYVLLQNAEKKHNYTLAKNLYQVLDYIRYDY